MEPVYGKCSVCGKIGEVGNVLELSPEGLLIHQECPYLADKKHLVAGETYKVKWEDCCIEGEFTASFIEYFREGSEGQIIGFAGAGEWEGEKEEIEHAYTKWRNGVVIGPVSGSWKAEKAKIGFIIAV